MNRLPASFSHITAKSRSRLIRLASMAVLAIGVTAFGSDGQAERLTHPPRWSGHVTCKIHITGMGYEDTQTHTWTIVPSLYVSYTALGDGYPMVWTVTGSGNHDKTTWTTDGSGMGIIAFKEEIDNQHDNLVISRWSGQQEDQNGVHVSNMTQPATIWETGLPTLTLQDGWNKDVNTPSMSEPINGGNGYQQVDGVTQTKDCEWHLTFNSSPFFTRLPGYLDRPRLGL